MKKLLFLSIACCTMVLSGCNKLEEFYTATVAEYSFSSSSNESSVKAILGTIYNLWEGEYSYKDLTTDESDVEAIARYEESVADIMLYNNNLKAYFESNDYFIYELHRTTDSDVLLRQTKFYLGNDGNLTYDVIYEAK